MREGGVEEGDDCVKKLPDTSESCSSDALWSEATGISAQLLTRCGWVMPGCSGWVSCPGKSRGFVWRESGGGGSIFLAPLSPLDWDALGPDPDAA